MDVRSASSGAPVGSGVFASGALLAIFVLVVAVLRRYVSLRATPAYLSFTVFLALALPASIVLLVPIDLASSNFRGNAPSGVWLPKRVVLVSWRITYWLTFVLTWAFLPLLGEYLDSGYRTPRDRIVYSLRSNGRYYLMVLCMGFVGLVYIIIQNGFEFTSLKSLLMALAYVWGLAFAIYLMGHGLVAIPRGFWRDVNNGDRLRRIQCRAPRVHERLTDSMAELESVEFQVKQLQKKKLTVSADLRDWIDELMEMTYLPAARLPLASLAEDTRASAPAVITERYLADLGRRLNRARHRNARFADEWARLVQEAVDCQSIIDSCASQHLEFRRLYGPPAFEIPFMTPYLRYHLHVNLLPAIRTVLAGIFALASVCIVWSEIIKSFFPRLSVIPHTVVWRRGEDSTVNFLGQVMAAGWILYMCSAAFRGITDAKVWGNRALVPRNTYPESACWYAGQVAKLTVPLSYNFLTFLPRDVQHNTTFYEFLGRLINLTPLGKGFDYFFPIFILFPVCATLFNFYGRVKNKVSNIIDAGSVSDDEGEDLEGNPSGIGTWREGRELIESELNGPGFLGLSSRSVDSSQRGQAGLSRSAGASRQWVSEPQSSRSVGQSRTRASVASLAADDEEEEDGNFFQSIAHRVKNTFETAPRPKWLQSMDTGIKRPKWMGGDGGGSANPPDIGDSSSIGRFLNRQSSEGRLRL
ncbi:hypothetical protein VTO42DRAFT_2 [Malbranchea cinnamomea]